MALALQSSPFAAVSANLVARVADALNIETEFVRPVASDNYRVTETENLFAYLRFYGMSPTDPHTGGPLPDIGAARYARVVGRRLRVYIYTRSGVDTYGGDEVALQGTTPTQTVETPPDTPGQFIAEELVLNALDDYVPLTNNVPLTLGPVHWVDSADGPPEREPEDEDGLVRSHLDFQVVYVLAQQAVEPAPTSLPAPVQVPE